MTVVGQILSVTGCLAWFVGSVMVLNVAFRSSLVWFFGSLFVPLIAELFVLTHWRATWRFFALSILGLAAIGCGELLAAGPL